MRILRAVALCALVAVAVADHDSSDSSRGGFGYGSFLSCGEYGIYLHSLTDDNYIQSYGSLSWSLPMSIHEADLHCLGLARTEDGELFLAVGTRYGPYFGTLDARLGVLNVMGSLPTHTTSFTMNGDGQFVVITGADQPLFDDFNSFRRLEHDDFDMTYAVVVMEANEVGSYSPRSVCRTVGTILNGEFTRLSSVFGDIYASNGDDSLVMAYLAEDLSMMPMDDGSEGEYLLHTCALNDIPISVGRDDDSVPVCGAIIADDHTDSGAVIAMDSCLQIWAVVDDGDDSSNGRPYPSALRLEYVGSGAPLNQDDEDFFRYNYRAPLGGLVACPECEEHVEAVAPNLFSFPRFGSTLYRITKRDITLDGSVEGYNEYRNLAVDPNARTITYQGYPVSNGHGMAQHPLTGELYVAFSPGQGLTQDGNRRAVGHLDLDSVSISRAFQAPDKISDLAFAPGTGDLYACTGPSDGQLYRIDLEGGPPTPLCRQPGSSGSRLSTFYGELVFVHSRNQHPELYVLRPEEFAASPTQECVGTTISANWDLPSNHDDEGYFPCSTITTLLETEFLPEDITDTRGEPLPQGIGTTMCGVTVGVSFPEEGADMNLNLVHYSFSGPDRAITGDMAYHCPEGACFSSRRLFTASGDGIGPNPECLPVLPDTYMYTDPFTGEQAIITGSMCPECSVGPVVSGRQMYIVGDGSVDAYEGRPQCAVVEDDDDDDRRF